MAGILTFRFRNGRQAGRLLLIAVILGFGTILHYFTPQDFFVPLIDMPYTRHAADRILFLLANAIAAFGCGKRGGLIVLGLTTTLMLPRSLWVSASPFDAAIEIACIGTITLVIIWMTDRWQRNGARLQQMTEDLKALNALSINLTESLVLDDILKRSLAGVAALCSPAPVGGGIFLAHPGNAKMRLSAALDSSIDAVIREYSQLVQADSLSEVAHSEELIFEPCVGYHGAEDHGGNGKRCSRLILPLVVRERVLGIMLLLLPADYVLDEEHRQLLNSVCRQLGIAVDNARLYESLSYYVREITVAQEAERKRIARELHDDTAQGLIALSRRIDALTIVGQRDPTEAIESLSRIQDVIDLLLQNVRSYAKHLRPPVLDRLGLLPAVEDLASDLKQDGLSVRMEIIGEGQRISTDAELVLFRIIQESLSNVKKHAEASEVLVTITFDRSEITASVQDNGKGFDSRIQPGDWIPEGKLGLAGIHERAKLIGGTLHMVSRPGGGTVVKVSFPRT